MCVLDAVSVAVPHRLRRVRRAELFAHNLSVRIEHRHTVVLVRRAELFAHKLATVVEVRFAVVKGDLCDFFMPLNTTVPLNTVSKLFRRADPNVAYAACGA